MSGTTGRGSVIEAEIDEVSNALLHLQRSQEELKLALQESGPDPDFREAINDNIVTIAKCVRARARACLRSSGPGSTSWS